MLCSKATTSQRRDPAATACVPGKQDNQERRYGRHRALGQEKGRCGQQAQRVGRRFAVGQQRPHAAHPTLWFGTQDPQLGSERQGPEQADENRIANQRDHCHGRAASRGS
jgi:hypothetical protein